MTQVDARTWSRIAQLFDELVDLPGAERDRRLAELTLGDPVVAREVIALLRADGETTGVLECALDVVAPELTDVVEATPWETAAGSVFGAYRLVERIGEGGMGEVWRAERADGAYQQQVALKLLKRGMDTQAILRRFLQERAILARLDHPNIVRVFDGGMTPDGRPWYAMACVQGQSLVEHASQKRLDVRERVALVATIADAVSYAHARLVVHRDLKPGNILIDAQGQPHLLDFGIAKLLEDTGEFTQTGTNVRVLSPAYAAPEQILGLPVGTPTDVYALGVIAYQLLTGSLPHRRSSRDVGVLAAEISQSTDTERASLAIVRGDLASMSRLYGVDIDRRRLARQIGGDLDLILTTALRVEPERRYASAALFAADLRAWLDAKPITARADSTGYRLNRFVRRHALAVAAGSLIVVSLVVGLAVAVWQAGIARAQAERAELVKDFVMSLFQESDPIARAQIQARSPRELVAAGIERANMQLRGDSELQMQVLADLGQLAFTLGDAELAARTLEHVRAYRMARERRPSVASAEVAARLSAVRSQLGDLSAAAALAREAIPVLTERLGETALSTAEAQGHLARTLLFRGEFDAALDLTRRVHQTFAEKLGPDHPETLSRLALIGVVLEQRTRLDEADQVFAEVVARLERTVGADHARLIRPLSMRGDVARRQERHADARPLLERAIVIARQHFGEAHPVLGAQLSRLAGTLRRIGDYDAAAAALDQAEDCFPPNSVEMGQVWMHRGQLYRNLAQPDRAAEAFERAHEVFLAATGESSGFTWASLASAAEVRMDQLRLDEAEPALERVIERMRGIFGADSYDYAYAATALGRLRRLQQRGDEAVALHAQALAIMARLYGEDNANTVSSRFELAQSLRVAGDLTHAREELDRVLSDVQPDTSLSGSEAVMRLESARLAQAQGDTTRQHADARAALDLTAASEAGDAALRAEAAALVAAGALD